ncbi:hypothetical protein DINM_022320 [Dirofilaria immitis]|nr:hypothetical protein [Dirofilaria immitis]
MSDDKITQEFNSTTEELDLSKKSSGYYFTTTEKSLLFSATAIGNLIGTYPVILLEKIKYQGFACASTYPVLGTITSQWSLLADSGMYMSLIMCHLQLGPLFTMPISGALCVSSFGWPATYYIHGILTLLIMLLFYILYRDSPKIHKNVSSKELSKIEFGKEVTYEKKMPKVPYGAILRDISIWGVWIASIGGTFGFQIFFNMGQYILMKFVLHFTVEKAGLATALPMILSLIVKVLAGPFSDHANCCSFMAACFIFLALIPSNSANLGQIAYTASLAFSGLNSVGVIKSAQLIARQHTHFILSIISIINCLVILIIPLFVLFLAPNNTVEQWSKIFYVIVGLLIICTIFFFAVGEASPASWTKVNNQQVYTIDHHETINDMITSK